MDHPGHGAIFIRRGSNRRRHKGVAAPLAKQESFSDLVRPCINGVYITCISSYICSMSRITSL